MGKQLALEPMVHVPDNRLRMALYRLRTFGHRVQLRGRGKPYLYVTPDCDRAILVRRTGRNRRTYVRYGTTWSDAELAFIHTL